MLNWRFDADVNPPEKKVQPENFKQTGNGYAPGNAVGRGFAKGNKSKNGNNHCQIEDNRCCGPARANLPKEFKMPD